MMLPPDIDTSPSLDIAPQESPSAAEGELEPAKTEPPLIFTEPPQRPPTRCGEELEAREL